ncbi:hypothetical protein Tco_0924087 [Tanacetum coccineum]|uniref:Uncharacterized protein n=1 Tax=Tanacetum coccineum TaxID=301880 RepID=A0ABQ5D3W4_9ASTR
MLRPTQTQTGPFSRPSPSIVVPDPEGSGGNHRGQPSNDASLSGNEDGLTLQSVYDLCVSLCKQVTAQAKEIKALKAQVKKLKKGVKPLITHHKGLGMKTRLKEDSFSEEKGDYEDDQNEGRTSSMVLEEKESVNKEVSTEGPVSTDKQNEGTDKKNYCERIFKKLANDRDGGQKGLKRELEAEEEKKRLAEEEATKAASLMNMISFRQLKRSDVMCVMIDDVDVCLCLEYDYDDDVGVIVDDDDDVDCGWMIAWE